MSGGLSVLAAMLLAAGAFADDGSCVSEWDRTGNIEADRITSVDRNPDLDLKHLELEYDRPDKRPIWFGARSHAERLGSGGEYYALINVQFDDGSMHWGYIAVFNRGADGWRSAQNVFFPYKPVKKINYYLFLRMTTGRVRFEDAFLKRTLPPEGTVLKERRFTMRPFADADLVDRSVFTDGKVVRRQVTEIPSRLDATCPLTSGTVLVWTADPLRRVSPLDFPSADDAATSALAVDLARAEAENAQICVSAAVDAAPQDVTVRVETPCLRDGTPFRGEIKRERIGYLARRDGYAGHRLGMDERFLWFPEPLLPFDADHPMRTVSGGTVGAWLTVRADREALSGLYEGAVVVSCGTTERRFALKVSVRSFALPKRFSFKSSYSVMDGFTRAAYPDDFKAKRRESWDLMLDHRLNPDDISRTSVPDLDELEYAAKRGMNSFNVLNLAPPPKDKNVRWVCYPKPEEVFNEDFYGYLRRTLTPYVADLRRRGLDKDAYLYGFDERESEYYAGISNLWLRLKRDFGLPLMTTAYMFHDVVRKKLDPDSPIASMTDIHVPLTREYDCGRDFAARLQRMGKQVWWYTCCDPGSPFCSNANYEYPLIECRLIAWLTEIAGADGFLYWHVNCWKKDRWMDERETFFPDWDTGAQMSSMPGDGVFLYPGKTRILPSLRLAAVRDGAEDVDWIRLAKARSGKVRVNEELNKIGRSASDFTHDIRLLRKVREWLGDQMARSAED